MKQPRVLVCGGGPIGRRHIANLLTLGAAVTAWRERPELADELAEDTGVPVVDDLEAAVDEVDAVVVATAPDRHVPVALVAAEAGRALYLEQPLAPSREGLDPLMDTCAALGLVVEMGYPLRLHPTLRALKAALDDPADGPVYAFRAAAGQRLDLWRPGIDHAAGHRADPKRGGGALFGLTQEIDLALWLGGPIDTVTAEVFGVGDLGIAADDLANLTFTMASGAVGQVQVDLLSPVARRSFEVVRRRAVLRWDQPTGRLLREDGERALPLADPPPGWTRNAPHLGHIGHFLRRLADPALPALAPLEDGLTVLEVALAARRASREGRRVMMTEPPQ